MISLRWRLALWYLGLTTAGLLGLLLVSYQVLSRSLRDEIDRTLAERANHVADAVTVEPNLPIQGIAPEATDEFRSPGVYLQILDPHGEIVAHSYNLGVQQLPVDATNVQRALSGETVYLTTSVEGQAVRLFHRPLARGDAVVGVVQVGQSLAGLETTLRNLRLTFAAGTAAVLLFGLLGGWGLARAGLQPVARVTQAARQIVHAEDLAHRVQYTGPQDEIGLLATTFNEMLDRLQAIFEGQRRFLAEAAHELRTPLSSMLGNVDLLARFGEDAARRKDAVAALRRTGRHVARLLDDLLLLAQAEAGWHLELCPLALDDVLFDAYQAARLTTDGISLRLPTCEPAWVQGDADRLRQVFTNLIANAMYHAPPGSAVDLNLWREKGRVRIQVTDSGAGVPPEALPHVFKPFFRAPGETHRSGAGLGLAIVHWIVREHGGEVYINSALGHGTTVTVSLPEIRP